MSMRTPTIEARMPERDRRRQKAMNAPMPIETPSIVLLCAAPRSGKSYTIRWLLTTLAMAGKFDYGVVFSTSGKVNGDYDYVPQQYVHAEYTDEKLAAILRHQDKRRSLRPPSSGLKGQGSNLPTKVRECPPMFLVFDDMTGQVNMNSKVFTRLITSYRHYNITLFFAAHLITRVSTVFRECCRYAFIFKQNTSRSVDSLWNEFFQDIPRDQLKEFIDEYTARKYSYLKVQCDAGADDGRYTTGQAPANFPMRHLSY